MTPGILESVVVVAYLSLALELTILHVPSVASTLKLWGAPSFIAASYSPKWRRIFELSRWTKAALLVFPVLVIWGVYAYPLVTLLADVDLLGDQLFSPTEASRAAAAALIVSGRVLTLWSVLTLREVHRGTPGLAAHGLFRYSRNPGLVGMYTFVAGLWLATPSLVMLCGILVYFVHMDLKVRMEEDYLRNTLGERYRLYERRTRRYLP